ncbi:MAG: hypothetical protein EAZ90_13550 [Oscillatoriales cyanobacterium]|nr:MAG: hypothetical protein EAZ90_13550 [Oscillatoriales cyanobacterium]TAF92515.1 MAG: hypothetical protein EAZ49_01740 [Oscillatoriales cyanobacterium]TAG07094.1 MAG: hypothetical protein EAZ45_02835 [Oscillatoriales cyanobacterium]TAG15960.1 MAG: hypothetical protein EAZ39_18690 [Oscillatoriales cyanobacterium]TAG44289.1 MAG: hypothetical protein EAZ33_10665 [Oscillatoriales cyanobacterium]
MFERGRGEEWGAYHFYKKHFFFECEHARVRVLYNTRALACSHYKYKTEMLPGEGEMGILDLNMQF